MSRETRTNLGPIIAAVISAVLTAISCSYALGGRIAAVETKTTDLGSRVDRLEPFIQSIDQRLARIEGKLDRK